MSPATLPPNPSLAQLKKQAKDLLKAYKSAEPEAIARLRQCLSHLSGRSDRDIMQASLSLKDAQQVIARQYGFEDWTALKQDLASRVRYFEDYRWSRLSPVGVNECSALPVGSAYFRFVKQDDGVRVEQYDEKGSFVRLCHHPNDLRWKRGWQKKRLADGRSAVVYDQSGAVVLYEQYQFLEESCADGPLARSETYNVEGRLIEIQEPQKVSHTAYDLYVKDTCGKLKGVIHHAAVDKGEPCDISEDWAV